MSWPQHQPDGLRAYVANLAAGTVSVIDTRTNAVQATIPVGRGPSSIAIAPDGNTVYVGRGIDNVVNSISGNSVGTTITVGVSPNGLAISPDGSRLWVAEGAFSANGAVQAIDTASNIVGASITVGVAPEGIAVSPDGTRLYVASILSNTVNVIDTARASACPSRRPPPRPTGLGRVASVQFAALSAAGCTETGVPDPVSASGADPGDECHLRRLHRRVDKGPGARSGYLPWCLSLSPAGAVENTGLTRTATSPHTACSRRSRAVGSDQRLPSKPEQGRDSDGAPE